VTRGRCHWWCQAAGTPNSEIAEQAKEGKGQEEKNAKQILVESTRN